jgi:sugar lactone lactonase YvrE
MAFAPSGDLYVSSRFEGKVYKVTPKGEVDVVVSKLGSTSGIVFEEAGTLFVGERSGQIFRVEASGQTSVLASLPSSIAAFPLAVGPGGTLSVTAPTLSTSDSLYRFDASGKVDVAHAGSGRPQGLAFDADGKLHVVEALAGAAGLYALTDRGSMQLTLAAEALVGVAFGAAGEVVVTSNDTAYRLSPGEGR